MNASSEKPLKIAVVVHGRFHAFALARELIRLGHDAVVFTNYPKFVVERFGIPAARVRSLLIHGIVARVVWPFNSFFSSKPFDALMHRWFGAWAAREVCKDSWDVIHIFSSVAEEILGCAKTDRNVVTIVRGSAHIREQARLLKDEQDRAGVSIDHPSPWMIAREEREYAKADLIFTLSRFARDSFVRAGVPEGKLRLLPLGTDIAMFRASPEVLEERRRRILSGTPLRVLTTGALTYQKGVLDLVEIARTAGDRFRFRAVGKVAREATSIVRSINADVPGKVAEHELPAHYAWADVFIFTTIQDGYAAVLAQAQANGLPLLITTNCAGSDLVKDGANGWVLPIRHPEAFVERLRWCDAHREALAAMVDGAGLPALRSWSHVAAEFAENCRRTLEGRRDGNRR